MLRQLLTLMDLFILANYPVSYKVVKVLQACLRDTFGTCLNVKTNDRMRMRNTRRHCVVLACIVAWFGHFENFLKDALISSINYWCLRSEHLLRNFHWVTYSDSDIKLRRHDWLKSWKHTPRHNTVREKKPRYQSLYQVSVSLIAMCL